MKTHNLLWLALTAMIFPPHPLFPNMDQQMESVMSLACQNHDSIRHE